MSQLRHHQGPGVDEFLCGVVKGVEEALTQEIQRRQREELAASRFAIVPATSSDLFSPAEQDENSPFARGLRVARQRPFAQWLCRVPRIFLAGLENQGGWFNIVSR